MGRSEVLQGGGDLLLNQCFTGQCVDVELDPLDVHMWHLVRAHLADGAGQSVADVFKTGDQKARL